MEISNLKFKNEKELLNILGVDRVHDMVKLAKHFEFKVYKLPLSTNIKGSILRGNCDGKINPIIVRDSIPNESRRFTLAYLFACYQLSNVNDYAYVLYDETIYDRKAYNYAMNLLLPDSILELYNNGCSTERLAKEYDVSEYLISEKIKKVKSKKFTIV